MEQSWARRVALTPSLVGRLLGRIRSEQPSWARRVAPTPSLAARLLGRIRGEPSSVILGKLVRRRRAARVRLARSGRTRLAPLGGRSYLAVVRRGEEDVFRRLEAHFRANRDVTVIWDRRLIDQPAAVGRNDRRITPITTWQDTAYILVPRTRP